MQSALVHAPSIQRSAHLCHSTSEWMKPLSTSSTPSSSTSERSPYRTVRGGSEGLEEGHLHSGASTAGDMSTSGMIALCTPSSLTSQPVRHGLR